MICVAGMGVLARGASSALEILWWTLPLVGALLMAAAVVAYLKRWRHEPGIERFTPNDQLSQFRSLYERGELSAEEFARIRNKLGARIKQELELPPKPAAEGAEPTPPAAEPDTNIRPGPPGAT
jgi:hypothetical protein